MQYLNNKIYVLVKEKTDWDNVDYVNTTDYDILAVSKDMMQLQIFRDEIIENEYKDWVIYKNTKDKVLELYDSKIIFVIKKVLFIE